jgi:hypothetical protein
MRSAGISVRRAKHRGPRQERQRKSRDPGQLPASLAKELASPPDCRQSPRIFAVGGLSFAG